MNNKDYNNIVKKFNTKNGKFFYDYNGVPNCIILRKIKKKTCRVARRTGTKKLTEKSLKEYLY